MLLVVDLSLVEEMWLQHCMFNFNVEGPGGQTARTSLRRCVGSKSHESCELNGGASYSEIFFELFEPMHHIQLTPPIPYRKDASNSARQKFDVCSHATVRKKGGPFSHLDIR